MVVMKEWDEKRKKIKIRQRPNHSRKKKWNPCGLKWQWI
jgi:hypothetical protein